MAAGAIDLERHFAPQFEPAPEHAVMLFLVGAVLLDGCDELAIAGAASAYGFAHPVERGIAAMIVIGVDRRAQVKEAAAKCGSETKSRQLSKDRKIVGKEQRVKGSVSQG